MTDQKKPFTCNVDGCGQTFASRAAKGQHRVSAHGKKPKAHYRGASRGYPMTHDDAYDFVDVLGLPDGAHWAMIEELSGAEPGDFAHD